jgi:hypothetical protein
MKTMFWWLVACIGLAVMARAYEAERPADDDSARFSSGLIVVLKSGSHGTDAPVPFQATKAQVRHLPIAGFAEAIAKIVSEGNADRGRHLQFALSEKLFELSLQDAGVTESMLSWGRLPRAGEHEVLAGDQASHHDGIDIDGRSFPVVGGLQRDAALFARSYLLPRDLVHSRAIGEGSDAVRSAFLIPLRLDQLGNNHIHEQLAERFPLDRFDTIAASLRTGRGPFFAYLLGQALLCFGGSGGLIGLYAAAARRVRWPVLHDPLSQLSINRRLIWGVHLVYFGLYFLAAVVVYQMPDIQTTLFSATQEDFSGRDGPLSLVGKAYLSGNIALAALVTFVVNFFVGSMAMLTLPSCVIPGSGVLVAVVRPVTWGLLLAPSSRVLERTMLAHSGTLLLEGEGYILATFFGLLIPAYLLRSDPALGLFGRYRRGLVLNLKGNILVALVLLVAAVYEASEVILMMK